MALAKKLWRLDSCRFFRAPAASAFRRCNGILRLEDNGHTHFVGILLSGRAQPHLPAAVPCRTTPCPRVRRSAHGPSGERASGPSRRTELLPLAPGETLTTRCSSPESNRTQRTSLVHFCKLAKIVYF